MRILALDTSTEVAGVAFLDGAQVRFSHTFLHRMDLSQRLLPALRWLLQDAGLSLQDADALAVGLGPGSFTGVRIGVTTAKVLAQVASLPIAGIGTLDVMAAAFSGCEGLLVCPAIDARKQEVYAGLFRMSAGAAVEVLPPQTTPAERLAGRLQEWAEPVLVCGTGSVRYREAFLAALGERLRSVDGHDFPDPVVLAHLGRRRLERGEQDDPLLLRPTYVRASEAERALGCAAP